MTDAEYRTCIEWMFWHQQYGGLANAHKIMILDMADGSRWAELAGQWSLVTVHA